MTGGLMVSSQNEKLFVLGKYLYDAIGQRIRLFERGTLDNQTFTEDILLLYREQVMYEINDKDKTCKKAPLKADFIPSGVPGDASLVGQVVLGDSSRPGEGLLVNTWHGELPNKGGKYLTTVTEFGCVPVTFSYQTPDYGWLLTRYFDNVIGISDPGKLNPPSFCTSVDLKSEEEPVDFFSSFIRKN
ncbi:ependymin-like isoform X2 [Halichoeres trimaculatus]